MKESSLKLRSLSYLLSKLQRTKGSHALTEMKSLTFLSQIGDFVNAKSSKGFSRLTPGLSHFSACG